MISAVKAFKQKTVILPPATEKQKRLQHSPTVLKMLGSHAGADYVLDVNKYCDLMSKVGQEFEDKFIDFDKLEPCVAFTGNQSMEVEIKEISEKMAELLTINPVEMEMEIINLRNHVQLKSQQHSQHFWSPVDTEN
ncbi:unnamed protein product [Lepeophtheirus salmonis]|uniref:(salmon louse) hypothetical protein n=1 Tax=Lepeophtheirus salmonis TaxID=72036 RepID=A0A7R8CGR3_LEPSM|nr:unnamed protein product [Lepeophtheirus salmonis]CAF2772588.1 unnamed protein product [Lepeophtheirus salmonis]